MLPTSLLNRLLPIISLRDLIIYPHFSLLPGSQLVTIFHPAGPLRTSGKLRQRVGGRRVRVGGGSLGVRVKKHYLIRQHFPACLFKSGEKKKEIDFQWRELATSGGLETEEKTPVNSSLGEKERGKEATHNSCTRRVSVVSLQYLPR